MARERLLAVTFGLSVAVAPGDDGRPVVEDRWVEVQIAEANRLFGPADVRFRWVVAKAGPARASHVETRGDRDALGVDLERRLVNVTVVGTLRDVDDPGRMRMGVCWQLGTDAPRRYVLLSSTAKPAVLAHELGHFFGNAHTTVADNLMSYVRVDPAAVAFDPVQIARIHERAAAMLASRALDEVLPARLWP